MYRVVRETRDIRGIKGISDICAVSNTRGISGNRDIRSLGKSDMRGTCLLGFIRDIRVIGAWGN
jgi:hypothetical protein